MEVEEIAVKTFSAVLSVVCLSSSVKSVLARAGWSLELVAAPAWPSARWDAGFRFFTSTGKGNNSVFLSEVSKLAFLVGFLSKA